jgi:hypothetical protein
MHSLSEKKFKYLTYFILFFVFIVAPGVYLLYKINKEQQMSNVVNVGQIVLDQTIHTWDVNEDKLLINMFIRNTSDYRIKGNLVFRVTLGKEGIEKDYLNKVIDVCSVKALKETLKKRIQEGSTNPKYHVLYNYLNRGMKLPKGYDFEPLPVSDLGKNDYIFKFRKRVSINAGEIIQLEHEQDLPPVETGYLFTIKMVGIEFR